MSKTLLLADDSVTIQKVVGISFANEDVRIVTVDNGDDAVSRAREIQPDIVLADVVMPGKSGYDVCAALKEDPALAHVPVLLLTGTFETFDEDRAARVGADGHITKPFEAQALVELVNGRLAGAPPTAERVAPAAADAATAQAGAGAPVSATPAGAEAEPFDFLEPELTQPRPRSDEGERLAALDEADPFDFDAESIDAADLDDMADDLGNEATEMRTTVLVADEPDDDELGQTISPSAPAASDDGAQTRLLMPEEVPAAEAPSLEPDPLDDVFDPVLGDEADAPGAGDAFDVASPESNAGFQTHVIADLEDESAEDDGLGDVAEPLFDDDLAEADAFAPAAEPAAAAPEAAGTPAPLHASTAPPSDELASAVREQLHETLEKMAWEAFGDLSERIVREAVDRIEQVAWDVMPRLAETLIREEIRKLKGEE